MAHRDVAEAIHDALGGEDAAGGGQVGDNSGGYLPPRFWRTCHEQEQ
jgi:hypothetical protein